MKIYIIHFITYIFCGLAFSGEIRENSEKEILNIVGNSYSLNFCKININHEIFDKIEEGAQQRFFKDYLYVWKIVKKDTIQAYAILDNVMGKAMPITFLVVLDKNGEIMAAQIIKYRENYGGEIRNKNWLGQFIGKNVLSDFKIGQDIDAISGATISATAVVKGIKKITMAFPTIKNILNEN